MTDLACVTDNRTFIEKADMALSELTSGAGVLLDAQAQKFIRLLIEEAVLMPKITVVPMRAQKQLIEKTRFTSQVLQPGQEATALAVGQRSKPDLTKVQLDSQLFKAEVRLSDEILEDNIERAEFRNTIMATMAEAIARDMENVMINGDTGSGTPLLAVLDGILKQATSNVVAAGLVPLNKTAFRDSMKAMPDEFLRDKGRMGFMTSIDAECDYRDSIADRQTIAGDAYLTGNAPVSWSGIPCHAVSLFPETLGGGNETNMLFCDPKNIHLGIQRKLKIETERLVREGVLIIVATLRMDVKFAEETAVVKTTGITVS